MSESNRLLDSEIDHNLSYKGLEVEIVDSFSKHEDINTVFKTKSCEALSDVIKFFISQQFITTKKQDKRK